MSLQPRPPDRARSHGRTASSDERRRVAIPRRTTRGPLDDDIDDPLASGPAPPLPSEDPLSQPGPVDPTLVVPKEDSGVHAVEVPSKDFSFLQDPQAYHILSTTNVPPAFLAASDVSPKTPIETLLASGHFRLAAGAAARDLVSAPLSTDYETLLKLLHIRLACLCLIDEHALAAQECKVLGDLNSTFYRHPLTDAHLVPWDLRLLVVRLAALGYGEWRKGVMGYYELARECRENIVKAADADEVKILWRARLRDCGIRVANVLVEMGDLEGAARHLASLRGTSSNTDHEALVMETLVWLRIGDVQSAKRTLALASSSSDQPDVFIDSTLAALILLADSDYEAALDAFSALHTTHPDDAMITQNLAVCHLYTGRIATAKTLLADLLTDECPPFRSAVFNLSTIYELCTERSAESKAELAEKLAARRKGSAGVGWELAKADFKL